MRTPELENRLVTFSVKIVQLAKTFPNDHSGLYFNDQITRSACASTLNYGEAKRGGSQKEFIQQMKTVSKELTETLISLKIAGEIFDCCDSSLWAELMQENNDLISIFIRNIKMLEVSQN